MVNYTDQHADTPTEDSIQKALESLNLQSIHSLCTHDPGGMPEIKNTRYEQIHLEEFHFH